MNHPAPSMRPFGAEASATWIAAASLYFLLAASMIHFTSDGLAIATVWPANAVLVALLLLKERPRWSIVLSAGLVGNVAANLLTRGSVQGPLLYSLANGLEVVIAVTVIRRGAEVVDLLGSIRATIRFILAAGVVAPAISGVLGAATATMVYGQVFAVSWENWFLSDALGLLVFTPVFMAVFSGQLAECFHSKTVAERGAGLALLALVAATSYVVFFVAALPALFVLYAPVMLVTFRVGPLGTKMAVMTIAVVGAWATATGHGPVVMMTLDPVAQAHSFQAFLAVMLLTCLPVAAEVAERARLAQMLEAHAASAVVDATTDTLTGMLNRRGFERALAALQAGNAPTLCCVAIDVDRFKSINDQWGHQFGDEVLRHLAATLRSHTRPGDLVGRFGGDEFMLVLQVGSHRAGEAVCARVQNALRQQPVAADDKTQLMVSISCGVAHFTNGDNFHDVAERADRALYEAKRHGRNTFKTAF
ncbi:diguanylate cyclase [Sphingomonas sp. RHCKR47]|uniref:GGDEF domain-containing protein n=1 Tax=Sphingomonas citricola TaxID=2862498 RepID=UPI001CA4B783|nr:GGDEF domain-containing protein [Sphingomonas citricola]MBW6522052.1 diguanylate cyclase [Sphingomonas citricola]